MPWQPTEFQIHHGSTAVTVPGYEYRDLGLHLLHGEKDKAVWSLTHLGTGLQLCKINGSVRKAFPVAIEIAEAGDWGFISMVGHKDRFPNARQALADILAKHTNAKRQWREYTDEEREAITRIAQQIAATR